MLIGVREAEEVVLPSAKRVDSVLSVEPSLEVDLAEASGAGNAVDTEINT